MLYNPEPPVSQAVLANALELFREMVAVNEVSWRRFVPCRQGVIDGEEGYKARNHAIARRRMGSEA